MKNLKIIVTIFILITSSIGGYFLWESNKNVQRNTVAQKDITQVINKLYPEIALDYIGVHEERIIQDLGQPNNKIEATGFIDGGFWSEDHLYYNYSFDNGTIAFYINKETRSGDYIEVILNDNVSTKIFVPGLINKGENYNDIILGVSTFGDIFHLMSTDSRELKNIISYEGGSASNHYTNLDFYFGKFGEYHEFTFGIPNLFDEEINKNYLILSDKKPRRLLIK